MSLITELAICLIACIELGRVLVYLRNGCW